MGLVINTNVPALNTARILRRSTLALNKSLQRLSSGLRINSAADDAAGLAIADGFQARVRGLAVAQRNAQDGISLIQTAEGALSEITNIVQRMRELAVQSRNGTNTPANRININAEVQQLILQIEDIANRTEFNGVVPLNASIANVILQVGADVGQLLTINLTDSRVGALGLTGANVLDVAASDALIAAIDATSLPGLALNRANLGAQQNRLEFTINTLAIEEENSTAAESAIRDANIATETIQFTRNQILVTAGTAILAQANLVPQTALQLLG